MAEKKYLYFSLLFICAIALANLARFMFGIAITIGHFTLPGWTGAPLFILFGLLAGWSFRGLSGSSSDSTNSANP